jgi:hypothetical protein
LALLAAALIGDLLFLPALLASSLGKVFDPKTTRPPGPKPHLEGMGERPNTPNSQMPGREIENLPQSMRHDDPHV